MKLTPTEDSPILGYTYHDGYWKQIVQPKGFIYTQAFILCTGCGTSISSHGGPRYNSYCLSCYKLKQGHT